MKRKLKLTDRGAKPTAAMLAALENQIRGPLPIDVREFLLANNGGEFETSASFETIDRQVDVRGVLRLEENHIENIPDVVNAISDRLDCSGFLPVMFTFSGDFVVVSLRDSSVHLWSHETNDVDFLAENLKSFFDEVTYEEEKSPFQRVCQIGDLEAVRQAGFIDAKREEVVQEAARQGNLRLIKEALAAGFPMANAVRFAAMNGRGAILDYFIAMGIDLNARDGAGRTVLDWVEWEPTYYNIVKSKGGKSGKKLS